MTARTRQTGMLAALLCLSAASSSAPSQPGNAEALRKTRLEELSQRLEERARSDRAQVEAIAQQAGIALRRNLPEGGVLELQRIVPGLGPIFYITTNLDAADTVSTDDVWPGGLAGLNLNGVGMTVGEWDGGAVAVDHPDLQNVTQVDGATEVSGHSTHVAGTLVSAGSYPPARGMAAGAHLNAWDWNNDTAEMAAAAAGGLLLSNHSYGAAAGWVYVGPDYDPDGYEWWWIGGPGDEDPKFGYYDAEASLWDQIAFDAPDYLIVKAAGNDRWDIGPDPGETYRIVDDNGNPLGTSTLPRPADCTPTGYDCLSLHSVAKNILTVGAVDDLPGGYSPLAGPAQVSMAGFSAWGPTDDGRIKPDIVGNGVLLLSTYLLDVSPYAAATGTSMASPSVTGSLLLLQEQYQNRNGGQSMRGATLKALAIHSADEAGRADGPDYEFGWGLLNTRSATDVISGVGGNHQIIEGTLASGETATIPVNVSAANSVIRATLVWMDPPATPAAPSLDPPDLMLVNDLDLRIIGGATVYEPWVLDPAAPAAAATKGDNFRDNVEQVLSPTVGPGSYSVQISHKGSLAGGSQDYALIISVETAPPTSSGLIIDEDFTGGLPAGWSVETVKGKPWTINTPVAGDQRLDNLTGGAGEFAIVDNNYSYDTRTMLRTPMMDLRAYDAAVVRFNSYFFELDSFESIHVDVSTDGGANWSTAWSYAGFNPFPTVYSLDVSEIAGSPTAAVRWRFDSNGWIAGDLWQIDNVQVEGFGGEPPPGEPPGPAGNPTPVNGATDVALDATLGWGASPEADSHNVYFGTDTTPDNTEFQGNQTTTSFGPGPLAESTTYYWRIDEVNEFGTTTGAVWSFTTTAAVSQQSLHLAGLAADAAEAPRGRWNAIAIIAVADADGAPLSGVLVEGTWSNGAGGSDSCTTGSAGSCSVSKSNLRNNVPSVDFTVANLSLAGHTYDEGANEVPTTVTITQPQPNLLPNAVNDDYATAVDQPVSGNVLANDDPGNAPATVTGVDRSGTDGGVSVDPDGSFTYSPRGSFEGVDTFAYTITDSNGDSSSATVTVTVGDPVVTRTVTATTSKSRGNNIVTVAWSGFGGSSVSIRVNGGSPTTTPNDGAWEQNLGKSPSGTYVYEVCEAGDAGACASDSVTY